MRIRYYDYKQLREKAMKTRAQEDINALGEWFEEYGMDFWNGEYFDADAGWRLRPIEEPDCVDDDGEIYQWKTAGYELY